MPRTPPPPNPTPPGGRRPGRAPARDSQPATPHELTLIAFPNDPEALGPRVALRHPKYDDRAEYLALRIASRAWLEKWEPSPPAGIQWEARESFDRLLQTSNSELSQRYLVCRRQDAVIMGQISLGGIIRGPLQQCFMGYWIARDFAGQGYMTEAVRLAQWIAFRKLALHRIECNMQPINAPSIALGAACGFRQEGFSPKYLEIHGKWADHQRWAMTIEDYEKLAWAVPVSPVQPKKPRR